jgi:RNA polymerase sigma factor (sigma-70 family)
MATAAPEISVLARDRAFESLYRRHVKDVYHYALALLRNPADAEDVTQTTFLNAYRAYSRGVEVEKPQNWLIKIAHNVARTRYARTSRRVKEVPLEDHLEQLAVPEQNKAEIEGVLEALGRLPFNQRAALVMRELEGRSYVEIADTINVSVSAVETLIFRARRSLRLKTSALRSLAAVPLPSQLAAFFDGGGTVAAGGGAIAGGGFIAKAAIAIVAGVLATGVGSDRSGPATAAREPAARPTAEQSSAPAPSRATVRPKRAAKGTASAPGTNRPFTRGDTAAQTGAGRPAAAVATATTARAAPGAGPTATTATTAVTAPIETVTSKAETVVATAQQTVSAAAKAVPLPLPPAPSLPPVPVDVPKIPGGTPLP